VQPDFWKPSFNLVGVNHKTLALEQREKLARLVANNSGGTKQIAEQLGLKEAALLSTCNRFEILSIGEDAEEKLTAFIADGIAEQKDSLAIYRFKDRLAVKHLFRVAASLDSMALGEVQILGQVKDAYSSAIKSGLAGKYLHALFQFSFRFAKRVRAQTAIGESGISVAYVAVNLAKQILPDFSKIKVLIIGSGQTAELTALHLKANGCKKLTVANRTLEKAIELANQLGGKAIALTNDALHTFQGSDFESEVHASDLIIGSALVDKPILSRSSLSTRSAGKPIFLIDLGVPRNFSSNLSELDDVYLYNLDDLTGVAEKNREIRFSASKDGEIIIEYGVLLFERWLRKISLEPELITLRDKILQICINEAQDLLGNDQAELADKLSRRISGKISYQLQTLLSAFEKPSGVQDEAQLEIEKLFDLIFERIS
jgi:glutamyl-tRNA reductase